MMLLRNCLNKTNFFYLSDTNDEENIVSYGEKGILDW